MPVIPKPGGPYSLFCTDCNHWVPNTANAEMRKEGVFAHSHICRNGTCSRYAGEIPDCGGNWRNWMEQQKQQENAQRQTQLQSEIEQFIRRFTEHGEKAITSCFTHGCCYWFAYILTTRFQKTAKCTLMYEPVENHFGAKIEDKIYDITGDVTDAYNEWTTWKAYAKEDPLETDRIRRDCIMF